MFKIFISETIYNKVIKTEVPKPEASRSNLYKLLAQQQVQRLSAEQTKQYKDQPETVLENPSSLYVLDITKAEALSIQKTFGVICLSGEDIDISPLIDINDIHIANEREKLGKGWDTVLHSVEKLPSNALLLTDRYLFAFNKPTAGDGIANIRNILNELLPQQFEGEEYHVTVIFDNMSKNASFTFKEIATRLNRLKQQLGREYNIMMEVLGITPNCSIYSKLHNRLIISNYYMVEASHKLAAFNKDRGTARQTLLPMTLFTESSINGNSTPPLKMIDQTINTLKGFSSTLSTLFDHSVYLYAVNGKRMKKCNAIRNRLIK